MDAHRIAPRFAGELDDLENGGSASHSRVARSKREALCRVSLAQAVGQPATISSGTGSADKRPADRGPRGALLSVDVSRRNACVVSSRNGWIDPSDFPGPRARGRCATAGLPGPRIGHGIFAATVRAGPG